MALYMSIYEDRFKDAVSQEPLVEKALARRYKNIPREEISIAMTEAISSFCQAMSKDAIENDNPAGYLWGTAVKALNKYLLHHQREVPTFDSVYNYDANDQAAQYFEAHETLIVILSLIKNERYREILKFHWLEGLSFEEIAAKQKRSIKAVYNCHERAMKQAQKIAAWLGFRIAPPQIIMPINPKNNSKKIENWWGKNRGIGTYLLTTAAFNCKMKIVR
jgi:DNA-directed RNA polymerase specialized sigma24 family protein